MYTHKMSIDKFGRSSHPQTSNKYIFRGSMGALGLRIDEDGNYDFQFKNLINVNNPINTMDVATKKYVDDSIQIMKNSTEQQISNLKHDLFSEMRNEIRRIYDVTEKMETDLKTDILKIKDDAEKYMNKEINFLISHVNALREEITNIEYSTTHTQSNNRKIQKHVIKKKP